MKWIGAALVAFACTGAWAQTMGWVQLPGAAVDIGVGGPNNTAWVIGTNAEGGGYGIYRWNGSNWDKIPGSAVRIDVDPQGRAWVVNAQGGIYRYNGNGWDQMPGSAKGGDIGIGANGAVWLIGGGNVPGGLQIYKWNGSNWTNVPGGALRIDVDPQGNPWVVNSSHTIFKYDGQKWVTMPGAANDVGVGADGSVFVVGTDGGVYKWTGSTWAKVDGGLTDITVDAQGHPWGVNAGKQIFASKGGTPVAGGGGGSKLPPGSPLTKLVNVTNGPALSSTEANAVFTWIAHRVASERTEYCYKQSYTRTPYPPTTCPSGQQSQGLCFPNCPSGYDGVGPTCWQRCPSGYTDTGMLCQYSAKSYVTTKVRTGCAVDSPWGCVIPSYGCPSGYTDVGVACTVNTPGVPPGYSGVTGLTLNKGTTTRAGYLPSCGSGQQFQAGACYNNCNSGYTAVAFVCWSSCPSGKVDCGAGCGKDATTCGLDTASMVLSPIMAVAGWLSGGAATEGWQATLAAVKAGASTAYAVGNASYQAGMSTYTWVNDATGNFAQITTASANNGVNSHFSPLAAKWVKEQYALINLNMVAPDDGTKTALSALSAASGFDPSGVSGVVSAYAKPICSSDEAFPVVHPRY